MPSVESIRVNDRGEVQAEWNGEPCHLRPTLAALDSVQTETGLGVLQILDQQAEMRLRLPHLVSVVRHTSTTPRTSDEVAQRIEADGLIYWGRVVSELLARAIYGQKPMPRDLIADPPKASPG